MLIFNFPSSSIPFLPVQIVDFCNCNVSVRKRTGSSCHFQNHHLRYKKLEESLSENEAVKYVMIYVLNVGRYDKMPLINKNMKTLARLAAIVTLSEDYYQS